jgi:phage terminase large subunit-like protein
MDLTREEKEQLILALKEKDDRVKYNFIDTIFPDEGPILPGCTKSIARENYPKHIAFINAGADYTERAFIAGNRCGKTLTGLYELVTHCTGRYPSWWEGKKFNRPVQCWLVGDRGEIIRDSMQQDLMGRDGFGTGLIPRDCFEGFPSGLQGCPGGYGTYHIKHISGGISKIIVKTYQSGKNAFESASVDVAMLDEETPMDIYTEVQIRVMTTGGTVYNTFTPDSGLTETVLHFLEKPKVGEQAKFVSIVGWADIPHLSEERQKQLLSVIPPHLRDCKTKGSPYMGTGAIYPIPEDDITCEPFDIPFYWPRAFALDPSWGRTAVVWGAYNEQEDIWYVYSEYIRGQAEIPIHVEAIKSRGAWIAGVVDPYAVGGGRGKDGEAFLEAYAKHGLDLELANNAVEAGIQEVYERLSTGRLKIFKTCTNFFYEYRMYRRDDKGKIVKKNDDGLDCVRYLVMSGDGVAIPEPTGEKPRRRRDLVDNSVSIYTGY